MIKQGAGNSEGDIYQLWLGVSIIKDWILSEKNNDERESFWLEQEIGRSKAGIFDDIQVFEKDKYKFFQVKHTIKIIGDLIKYDDLTSAESKISIQEIYSGFVKVRSLIGDKPFNLIIYSNKTAGNKLSKLINPVGQFIDTIRNVNPRAKTANKEIITEFLKLSKCTRTELRDALTHLYFYLGRNDSDGLISIVKQKLANAELTDHIFELNRKSKKEKLRVTYGMINYYIKNKVSNNKGFRIFMEEIATPNLSLIRENIELLHTVKLKQKEVGKLLSQNRKEIYNIIYGDKYNTRPINQEMVKVINEFVEFSFSFVKDKNDKIQEPIYNSLYLISLNLDAKKIVRKYFYDYLINLYENDKINANIVNILDNLAYFGNRIDEILKAIKNKNRIVFNTLSQNIKNDLISSKVNFTSQEKFTFRKNILIVSQDLDDTMDKDVQDNINDLIRILNREPDIIVNQKKENNNKSSEINDSKQLNKKKKVIKLLKKVENTSIKLSEILPDYLAFLLEIGEKQESFWVRIEISGNIFENRTKYKEKFEYRKILTYITNRIVQVNKFPIEIIHGKNPGLFKETYRIGDWTIQELEEFATHDDTEIVISEFLSKDFEFYAHNSISSIRKLLSNIRKKISGFLLTFLK